MLLEKRDFSTIGSEGLEYGTSAIYKVMLIHNYFIVEDEERKGYRKLLKKGELIGSVKVADVIEYLENCHVTYKLYVKRIETVSKSKFQSKLAMIPEYENILEQIIEIYIAKYLFKKIPISVRVDYLK